MKRLALLAAAALLIVGRPVGAQELTTTPASTQCSTQTVIGGYCVLTITAANVALTGDQGSVAVPAGFGDFATPTNTYAVLRGWSAGAVGTVSATVRTATSGGGSQVYAWSASSPPATGTLTHSTTASITTLFNSATTPTLTLNISASTATGSGSFDIPLVRMP